MKACVPRFRTRRFAPSSRMSAAAAIWISFTRFARWCGSTKKPRLGVGAFWHNRCLRGIVHVVFDRVRRHFIAQHLGHLELDERIDLVVVEHAARLEEGAVLVEALERFPKAAADRRN